MQTGSETELLKLMLAFQRLEMLRLASDLTEEQARWRPHQDANSIAELVSHLAWVERWWFESVFSGAPDLSADPAWPGFAQAKERSMPDLIEAYTSAFVRSNEVVDRASLDDEVQTDQGPTSLRYIILHMIEETARHAGHADITRQLIDGFSAT